MRKSTGARWTKSCQGWMRIIFPCVSSRSTTDLTFPIGLMYAIFYVDAFFKRKEKKVGRMMFGCIGSCQKQKYPSQFERESSWRMGILWCKRVTVHPPNQSLLRLLNQGLDENCTDWIILFPSSLPILPGRKKKQYSVLTIVCLWKNNRVFSRSLVSDEILNVARSMPVPPQIHLSCSDRVKHDSVWLKNFSFLIFFF
jgi:hypothetical protein